MFYVNVVIFHNYTKMEKNERNTLLIRNNKTRGKLINCSVFVDISTKAAAAGLSLFPLDVSTVLGLSTN